MNENGLESATNTSTKVSLLKNILVPLPKFCAPVFSLPHPIVLWLFDGRISLHPLEVSRLYLLQTLFLRLFPLPVTLFLAKIRIHKNFSEMISGTFLELLQVPKGKASSPADLGFLPFASFHSSLSLENREWFQSKLVFFSGASEKTNQFQRKTSLKLLWMRDIMMYLIICIVIELCTLYMHLFVCSAPVRLHTQMHLYMYRKMYIYIYICTHTLFTMNDKDMSVFRKNIWTFWNPKEYLLEVLFVIHLEFWRLKIDVNRVQHWVSSYCTCNWTMFHAEHPN